MVADEREVVCDLAAGRRLGDERLVGGARRDPCPDPVDAVVVAAVRGDVKLPVVDHRHTGVPLLSAARNDRRRGIAAVLRSQHARAQRVCRVAAVPGRPIPRTVDRRDAAHVALAEAAGERRGSVDRALGVDARDHPERVGSLAAVRLRPELRVVAAERHDPVIGRLLERTGLIPIDTQREAVLIATPLDRDRHRTAQRARRIDVLDRDRPGLVAPPHLAVADDDHREFVGQRSVDGLCCRGGRDRE